MRKFIVKPLAFLPLQADAAWREFQEEAANNQAGSEQASGVKYKVKP
jgi:hypothetical protein